MTKLVFAATPKAALRGSDHVVLVGARQALSSRSLLAAIFGPKAATTAQAMIRDASPSGLGKVATAWTAGPKARKLSACVLPDSVSRHLSPSRSHAIQHCAGKLQLRRGRACVVLCLDSPSHWLAAANAVARALPLYDRRTRRTQDGTVTLAGVDRTGRPVAPPPEVALTVESARWAASLVDRPTAELTTADFVSESKALLADVKGVKVRVLEGEALLRAGLGGLHAVGRAAQVGPRLLVLEAPFRGRPARTVALVGKGVVFDTGGLALKPRDAMSGMKGDMGGGAAVVGAFRVLAQRALPHRLLALVPLAENAIGPASYRQDEILALHSGRTVEINNTDAEGRLLLADAASYAARELGADVVVDAATLTGAQPIATGRRHAAVISNLEGLERLAVEAGRSTGDVCHPLPFAPEIFQREFESEVADMLNSVKDRANAQTSCAAQFVWSHLEDTGVAWLHVDLAGPAEAQRRGTGYGVALLAGIVDGLEESTLQH